MRAGTTDSERAGARGDWATVLAYAGVAGSTQLLWLSFAALTSDTARHYRVSETAVGWLAEMFPLLYVILALPAGRLLDRAFHRWLAVGALLTAVGAVVRVLGGERFAWVLAGQVLVAVAQPLVLGAMAKLAAQRLPVAQRAHGIAAGSAGVFGGMLAALLLATAVGGSDIPMLLGIEAALAVAATAALCITLARPGTRSAQGARGDRDERAGVTAGAMRAVWAGEGVRVLSGLLFLGFGVFIALTTWLQALLGDYGIGSSTAGALLVAMVAAGALGSALLPPVVVRRRGERAIVTLSIAAAVIGSLVVAVVHTLVVDALVLVPIGLLLLTDLPVILELAERRAGAASGTVTGVLWLAGNAGGLVVALLVGILVHHPAVAFIALAALSALATPLLRRLGALSSPELDGAGEVAGVLAA